MIKITNTSLECLKAQIGLRGDCSDADDFDCFIDDLPGIDIVRMSNITTAQNYGPAQVFESISRLSVRQVKSHFMSLLSKTYKHTGVIDDDSITLSGSHEFYGELDEFLVIEIETLTNDKFIERVIDGFRLNIDRDVVGKKFYVRSSDGDEKELTMDLKKGINKIPISIKSSAEKITISFDVSNFKVGIRDNYVNDNTQCGCLVDCCDTRESCSVINLYKSPDGCDLTSTSEYFGFDLCVRCQCSSELVTCYFAQELQMALLYRYGINYLMHVVATDRINQYTHNSKSSIEKLLLNWNGGLDMTTGIKEHSQYWKELKVAVDNAVVSVPSIDSICFDFAGDIVDNALPG